MLLTDLPTTNDDSELDVGGLIALEQALLNEELNVVDLLKSTKTELRGLLIERMHYQSRIAEIKNQANVKLTDHWDVNEGVRQLNASSKEASCPTLPSTPTSKPSLDEEFDLPSLDEVLANDIELNLSVPSNPFNEILPEEECEELYTEDIDFEMDLYKRNVRKNRQNVIDTCLGYHTQTDRITNKQNAGQP